MKFIPQKISGHFLIIPDLYQDKRGVFRRSYCRDEFAVRGIDFTMKQGNISENFNKYTLRGFHYQIHPSNESKIITCIAGSIYSVVIDLREQSNTYKQWSALEISSNNRESIYVPTGCANAFLTMENDTILHYYMGDSFSPNTYNGIRYNDPEFSVHWPCEPAIISEKDLNIPNFTSK